MCQARSIPPFVEVSEIVSVTQGQRANQWRLCVKYSAEYARSHVQLLFSICELLSAPSLYTLYTRFSTAVEITAAANSENAIESCRCCRLLHVQLSRS